MASNKLIVLCLALGLTIGVATVAWSKNLQPGRDQTNTFQAEESKPGENSSQEEYQFFSPVTPILEENFLILEPDGKTASDYQKFLNPLNQMDKKSDR
jgi:hypothetical protein